MSILTACATPSAPAEAPKPKTCDPRISAAVGALPALPAGASIVQPATPAEKAATALFLDWVTDLKTAAGELVARAELARQACAGGP